jgi:hypothetical protein
MTIRTTTWNPDTCDCEIKYSWDDTLPEDTRIHSISFVNRSCNSHRNLLPNTVVTYSCIIDENNKKNKTLQTALENAPNQLADVFQGEDGVTQYYQLKNNIIFSFSFSGTAPNRILTVNFIGATLTNQQRNAIQNKLNQIFGSGNVVIQ